MRTYAQREDYEHYALDRLQRFVKVNAMCPGGYDIVERQVVEVPAYAPDFAYAVQDIYYRGKCK